MALRKINPLSQSDFTVTIAALPGIRFTTASGLKATTPETPFYDGFDPEPQMIRQPPERMSVTLKAPYDPNYVKPVWTWYTNFNPSKATVLTVQPFDYVDGRRVDSPLVLAMYDVQPTSVELPEISAEGKDVAFITLIVSGKPVKPV